MWALQWTQFSFIKFCIKFISKYAAIQLGTVTLIDDTWIKCRLASIALLYSTAFNASIIKLNRQKMMKPCCTLRNYKRNWRKNEKSNKMRYRYLSAWNINKIKCSISVQILFRNKIYWHHRKYIARSDQKCWTVQFYYRCTNLVMKAIYS